MDEHDDLRWYDDVDWLGGVDLTLWVKLLTAVASLAVLVVVGAQAL